MVSWLSYTSEKVVNEIFANPEREFNSDSGENEEFSYVEKQTMKTDRRI